MKNKTTTILIIIIFLLLIVGYFYTQSLRQEAFNSRKELRKTILEKDRLLKVNETQYRKLVADTLTKRELRKTIEELGVELDNVEPKVVFKTKYILKEVDKPIDELTVKNDTLIVSSTYPDAENPFIKYNNIINLKNRTGKESWQIAPITISGVLSQRDDGIWQSDFKVPKWLTIEDVDIKAQSLQQPKVDNFNWILGIGLGRDLKRDSDYLRFNTGIRYKKLHLGLGASTNGMLDTNISWEF